MTMRLLPDVDVLILMATALASKRRPATLTGIVAAADLIQGAIPFIDKLGDGIRRLSSLGLIASAEEGYTLTPPAQKIMAAQPKKAEAEELIAAVRESLAAYRPTGEYATVVPSAEELADAILAHKADKKVAGKNMLMPKPKPDRHFKIEGRWRRAPGTRGRKA